MSRSGGQSSSGSGSESVGAKLRRLAHAARNNHAWARPYMKAIPPWQPSTAFLVKHVVANGGNLYVCGQSGTSAATGGPTQTNGQASTDGTAKWYYFGPNLVTQDPATSTPAWAASTAYTLGQQRVNQGGVYAVVVAGTSAGSGGPTTLTNSITDGTVTWTYLGPVWANPYANDFPVYTYGTTAPAGLTNIYYASGIAGLTAGKFSANGVLSIVTAGTGYVVGDVITIATGTFTTPVKVRVTAIGGGGTVTGAVIDDPGSYSSLTTALPQTQASTTGTGTGATFYIHFTQPGWCRIRGGDPARTQNGPWTVPAVAQMNAGTNETFPTIAVEFMSDAPAVSVRMLALAGTPTDLVFIVDGVRYNLAPFDVATDGSNNNFYTLAFRDRKARRWRIERKASTGFSIPPVYVDTNSSCWLPDEQDTIKAAVVGDSLIAGAVPGPFVPGNCVPFGLAHELGWSDVWDLSVGTTGHTHESSGGAGNQFIYRIRNAAQSKFDVWVIAGSWNDMGEAGIAAAVTAEIAAIRATGSKAPIIYIGVWSANSPLTAATEAAIKAGIDAAADTGVYWVPISSDEFFPWVAGNYNNTSAASGLSNTNALNAALYIDTPNSPHPADIGTRYEWQRMAEAIRQRVLPQIP